MDDLSLPMLSIQEKAPCPTPNPGCTEIADQELSALLRSRFKLNGTIGSLENRLDQWFSYFHALSKIKRHYTIALERSHLEDICFTWKDAFKPSKKNVHTTISLEKVAVVFNIAAVYSQMASAENRGTDEGLNKAYKGFQNAAGALRYLLETFEGGESVDVSSECVSMLETLMIAQALECFFSKAVRARKLSANCSKVARQVGLYYEEVQRALSSAPFNQHFDKGWFAHVQLKASQFYAESCYHYSLHLHGKEEIGEEITRLQMGLDRLRSTKKSVKGASSSLTSVISRLEENMNANIKKAEKENNSIFYMRVPATGSLNDLPTFTPERPKPPERFAALDEGNVVCKT